MGRAGSVRRDVVTSKRERERAHEVVNKVICFVFLPHAHSAQHDRTVHTCTPVATAPSPANSAREPAHGARLYTRPVSVVPHPVRVRFHGGVVDQEAQAQPARRDVGAGAALGPHGGGGGGEDTCTSLGETVQPQLSRVPFRHQGAGRCAPLQQDAGRGRRPACECGLHIQGHSHCARQGDWSVPDCQNRCRRPWLHPQLGERGVGRLAEFEGGTVATAAPHAAGEREAPSEIRRPHPPPAARTGSGGGHPRRPQATPPPSSRTAGRGTQGQWGRAHSLCRRRGAPAPRPSTMPPPTQWARRAGGRAP